MTAHVLLVGEETALPALLGAAGYRVTVELDLLEALAHARDAAPDIVLLDLALSGLDGQEMVHAIRQDGDMPVILLSDPDQEAEKIAALDEGADDYIDAPFARGELLTRIRLATRRRTRGPGGAPRFAAGALDIDFLARQVRVDGQPVRLSPKEYALLRLLAQRAGQVVSHRSLLAAGWGAGATDTQYLRVYIGLLRQKIEEDAADPRIILTEPGIGYRLAI